MKKTLNIITIIFSLILISSLVSAVADNNISIQINTRDNVTISTDNWNCTLSNGTASQTFALTTGIVRNQTTNMSIGNVRCQRGSNATLQYILNVTNDIIINESYVHLNISYTRFNLTENHSLTSYTRDRDIMFQYNITNFEAIVANDITLKAYLTGGSLRTGCTTQTNLYDFKASSKHLVNVTLDLTSCAISSYYLDYGVFDAGDSTAVSIAHTSHSQTSNVEEIVFRRETVAVTEGANSVISDDTLEGLPAMGTQVGDFLGNIVTGLGKFMLVIGLFAGIVGIIGAIVYVVVYMVKGVSNYKNKK